MLSDTTPEAQKAQLEAQRRLGGAGRFLTACHMSTTLRTQMLSRIRREHPELDEAGQMAELVWELYGIRRNA